VRTAAPCAEPVRSLLIPKQSPLNAAAAAPIPKNTRGVWVFERTSECGSLQKASISIAWGAARELADTLKTELGGGLLPRTITWTGHPRSAYRPQEPDKVYRD